MTLKPITDPNAPSPWPTMSVEALAQWEARKRQYDADLVRERIREHRLARLCAELGERWEQRTFDRFVVEPRNLAAYQRAQFVVDSGFREGAAFYGDEGNGKTHLAAAIVHAAIEAGKSARFITFKRLIDRLITAERAGNKTDVLWSYIGADVLVLDDVGKEDQTAWSATTRFDAVNARYETGRPLVITANMSLEDLIGFYGGDRDRKRVDVDPTGSASMLARIAEMCGGVEGFVANLAPSQRWTA